MSGKIFSYPFDEINSFSEVMFDGEVFIGKTLHTSLLQGTVYFDTQIANLGNFLVQYEVKNGLYRPA